MADILAILSGSLVGFALRLVGGGGSILAVPLLLYVVRIGDPHLAIGTSAVAVAANAFANLIGHWRVGNVKWPCAAVFAAAGMAGAAIGSSLGLLVDGRRLLVLFALVMIAMGIAMLRPRAAAGDPGVRISPRIALRLALIGLIAGAISGFFGIGGGFLIVPGIMLGSGMAMLNAVGSSLFSVGIFGLTTATSYALAGFVAWPVALELIAGGIVGGLLGLKTSTRLAARKGALSHVFAVIVFAVAAYMLWQTAGSLLAPRG